LPERFGRPLRITEESVNRLLEPWRQWKKKPLSRLDMIWSQAVDVGLALFIFGFGLFLIMEIGRIHPVYSITCIIITPFVLYFIPRTIEKLITTIHSDKEGGHE
jgi:hypothetical protein